MGFEDQHPPQASSIDGRAFSYEVPIQELSAQVGAYLLLDDGRHGSRLGQVTGAAVSDTDRRNAVIEGRMLDRATGPFGGAAVRIATSDDVADWMRSAGPAGARLDVGRLSFAEGVPLVLDAGAFDRHTFLCGQSGSGKTYALGTLLERLVAETGLRIVVIDPNSDFVHLPQLRDDASDEARAAYDDAAVGIDVRRAAEAGKDRLHVRFRDFDGTEMAAVLRLDPIDDRTEYEALTRAIDEFGAGAMEGNLGSVRQTVERLWEGPEPLHSLGVRARNLGVDRWSVWSGEDPESLQDLVGTGGPRVIVADIGSLGARQEQVVAAEAILAALWRRRAEREPTLIVIDEAHNVCPGDPADPLTALATEHGVRIAGEGRKFGLVLLVATQRPQKVHENIVSQCDNLILMRMNSRADLALVAETFSFVPPGMLALAAEFGQGEALVAGKLVPSPAIAAVRAPVVGGGRVGPADRLGAGSVIVIPRERPRFHRYGVSRLARRR